MLEELVAVEYADQAEVAGIALDELLAELVGIVLAAVALLVAGIGQDEHRVVVVVDIAADAAAVVAVGSWMGGYSIAIGIVIVNMLSFLHSAEVEHQVRPVVQLHWKLGQGLIQARRYDL